MGTDVNQGSIVENNPMHMVCIDFTKMDLSKNGKVNILVMMDAISKFSVTEVMLDQQAKTLAKALVHRWFHTYSIP